MHVFTMTFVPCVQFGIMTSVQFEQFLNNVWLSEVLRSHRRVALAVQYTSRHQRRLHTLHRAIFPLPGMYAMRG